MRLEQLESVGRYEIVGELGAGAMSKVYLAHDPNLDRKLALKVLLQTWSTDFKEVGELEKRFLLEARAAGKLSHPNIVRVFDADTDPETNIPYIAMEWIQGGSLATLLAQDGALSGPETLGILAQVARALDYAHQFGRIHRDIKPSNILITTDGTAKVSDFGVAKIVSETHTISGQVLGTPAYMSPEQVRDESLDGRSDLFSLGAVLYQCVTGRTPFIGDSLVQIVYKILNVDPRPVGLPRTEAWVLMKEIIDRALQKEPTARYQSGAQFAEFLEAAQVALSQEEDHQFRRELSRPVASPARTKQFQTPTPVGPERSRSTGPTRTLQLSNTEIRDAVETGPSSREATLETVVTTETTTSLKRQSRRRWVAVVGLSLAIGAGGSLVVAEWIDRRQTVAQQRLAAAIRFEPGPAYAADLVESHEVSAPLEPPEFEPERIEPPPARPTPPPVEESPKPVARQAVPILPPSAVSRTGVAQSSTQRTVPAEDVLTPVTIMYRHKGGDATLQVSLDGVRIWNQHLKAAEGRKQKLLGYDSKAVVSVPSGEHALEVRLVDPDRAIDATDTVVSRYTNGRKRSLRINLDPNDNVIQLRWKE